MNVFIKFYQQENCSLETATHKAIQVLEALSHQADFTSDFGLNQHATQQWLIKFQSMTDRDHQVYFQIHEQQLYRLYQFQQSGLINMLQGFRWLQADMSTVSSKQEAIELQTYWQLRHDGLQEIWKQDALQRVENATCQDIIPTIKQFIQ